MRTLQFQVDVVGAAFPTNMISIAVVMCFWKGKWVWQNDLSGSYIIIGKLWEMGELKRDILGQRLSQT